MLCFYGIVTPLGTIVCRITSYDNKRDLIHEAMKSRDPSIRVYDACMVTQSHVMRYFNRDDEEVTEAEALDLGILEPSPCEPVEDYVPIRANVDIFKTIMVLNTSSIVLHWQIGKSEELSKYIDHLNGRTKVEDTSGNRETVPDNAQEQDLAANRS